MRSGVLVAVAAVAMAQTKIDVGTQTKNIDFSSASATKPAKTGAELPASCSVGELFFRTSSPAGANLFACTAPNTWSVQAGNGAGGSVGVSSSGVLVGVRPEINLAPGRGVQTIVVDTGSKINVQALADEAVLESREGAQQGAALLCASTGGNSRDYRCALAPTASGYVRGMMLHWIPDVTAAGGATTLDVDTLGAASIKMPDGQTDPTDADIVAGRLYTIWHDGAGFRLTDAAATAGGGGGGAVASVFGRVGTVTAQTGDYTKAQVGLGNVLNVAQEPALGNPDADGKVLASTTGGVRSWVSAPAAQAAWGAIGGTLSNQSDLQSALNGKAAANSYTTVNGQACALGASCAVADATKLPSAGGAITGNLSLSGTVTPPPLAGDVNDYNPANCATSLALRVDGGAGDRNITGLQCAASAPSDGQVILIANIGPTNSLVLKNQSLSSMAANRFLLTGDVTLAADASLALRYDGVSQRWRAWSRPMANTGVTPGAYPVVTVDAAGRVTAGANSLGGTAWNATNGLLIPVVTSSSGPVAVTQAGFYMANAAAAGMTYNLPAISPALVGARFCFRNIAGATSVITLQAPASTYIDVNGSNGNVAGTLVSSGSLGDNACVLAVSTAQYAAYIGAGTWSNN